MSGVFSAQQLVEQGWSRERIEEARLDGHIRRLRWGWYAVPHADEAAIRAIKAGGRLGCLSALRVHGLWIPAHPMPHVMFGPGKAVPSRDDLVIHRAHNHAREAVFSIEDSLAQVVHRHDAETTLMAMESAVNLGHISPATARTMLAAAPTTHHKGVVKYFEPRSESGSETRLRLFLQQRGVPVRSQVWIDGVGRVDLLAGESLILEADSEEFHGSPGAVTNDRRRDVAATERGYARHRFTHRQLFFEWPSTQDFLSRILSSGHHLRPPRPLQHRRSRRPQPPV